MEQNQLTPFAFGDNLVRVLRDENGDPWFVAKDVCQILDLTNVTEATRSLDDDEKGSFRISEGTSSQGGNPNVLIISESGLYALVFRSRKPEARAFSKWVRAEVLPALRKTGKYEVRPGAHAGISEKALFRLREFSALTIHIRGSVKWFGDALGIEDGECLGRMFDYYAEQMLGKKGRAPASPVPASVQQRIRNDMREFSFYSGLDDYQRARVFLSLCDAIGRLAEDADNAPARELARHVCALTGHSF